MATTHPNADDELAAGHPLLTPLDADARDAILRSSTVASYGVRKTVLREGDPPAFAFLLLEGAVRVFHRQGDNEIVVKLFKAPAMFGEMEVLAGSHFLEYVTTLERSRILKVPAQTFRRAVERVPAFASAICKDLSRRLCIATLNERALAFDDIATRLCARLLDYSELSGEPLTNGRTRLAARLSQTTLAADLGVSRRAIVNALDRLRDEGLIDKRAARYELCDVERLRGISRQSTKLFYTLAQDAPGK